jgi:hypothetical protein
MRKHADEARILTEDMSIDTGIWQQIWTVLMTFRVRIYVCAFTREHINMLGN